MHQIDASSPAGSSANLHFLFQCSGLVLFMFLQAVYIVIAQIWYYHFVQQHSKVNFKYTSEVSDGWVQGVTNKGSESSFSKEKGFSDRATDDENFV